MGKVVQLKDGILYPFSNWWSYQFRMSRQIVDQTTGANVLLQLPVLSTGQLQLAIATTHENVRREKKKSTGQLERMV